MTDARLCVEDLVVEFVHEGYVIRPLDGFTLGAGQGELTVILGPSGSGKTTLLSCLGGILTPTSGRIRLGDVDVTALSPAGLADYRREQVGFVFQAFNLIPSLTALENVAVPLMLTGTGRRAALMKAENVLERVGLGDRLNHHPGRLSGGQQQRVAVARGLVHDPPLLLADEPTANLDFIQAESIITLLRELREDGRVIIVSTHDARLIPIADQVIQMAPEVHEVEGPPQTVQYVAGEEIFAQGDRPDVVYVVDRGEVEIVRVLADGAEERLAVIPAGQYFGELGPLLGFPRSASARAVTDVSLIAYGPQTFRRAVLGE